MTSTLATAIAEAARSLEASARLHKRSEFAHRRQAREMRAKLAHLQAMCDRLGIRLVLEGTRQGGTPNDDRTDSRAAEAGE